MRDVIVVQEILQFALRCIKPETSATGQRCPQVSGPILSVSNVSQNALKVTEVDMLPGMKKREKGKKKKVKGLSGPVLSTNLTC